MIATLVIAAPLAITTSGKVPLAAGTILCTQASDFVRTDGIVLPATQISSQAVVSNDGQAVTMRIWVAPRYEQLSGFGSYSGTISLNDSRAAGASVPVRIDVQYPFINRIAICGLLLAYAGLVWGGWCGWPTGICPSTGMSRSPPIWLCGSPCWPPRFGH